MSSNVIALETASPALLPEAPHGPLQGRLHAATAAPAPVGHVTGGLSVLLRLEGVMFLLGALALYHQLGGGWGMFALLFLVPDLSMLGYLVGPRVGAALYNAGHAIPGPVALGLYGMLGGAPTAVLLAAIWVGHIGFDRMLGYGLKYESSFFDTHLGRVGKKA